jgi:folylpolyglutamate synthase/dihydropteroate synthase
MGDKDSSAAFENIKKYGKSLTIPKLKTSRASSNLKIQETAINYGIENIKITKNVAEALEYLSSENDILIFGSFFLAGEVLEIIEI